MGTFVLAKGTSMPRKVTGLHRWPALCGSLSWIRTIIGAVNGHFGAVNEEKGGGGVGSDPGSSDIDGRTWLSRLCVSPIRRSAPFSERGAAAEVADAMPFPSSGQNAGRLAHEFEGGNASAHAAGAYAAHAAHARSARSACSACKRM